MLRAWLISDLLAAGGFKSCVQPSQESVDRRRKSWRGRLRHVTFVSMETADHHMLGLPTLLFIQATRIQTAKRSGFLVILFLQTSTEICDSKGTKDKVGALLQLGMGWLDAPKCEVWCRWASQQWLDANYLLSSSWWCLHCATWGQFCLTFEDCTFMKNSGEVQRRQCCWCWKYKGNWEINLRQTKYIWLHLLWKGWKWVVTRNTKYLTLSPGAACVCGISC